MGFLLIFTNFVHILFQVDYSSVQLTSFPCYWWRQHAMFSKLFKFPNHFGRGSFSVLSICGRYGFLFNQIPPSFFEFLIPLLFPICWYVGNPSCVHIMLVNIIPTQSGTFFRWGVACQRRWERRERKVRLKKWGPDGRFFEREKLAVTTTTVTTDTAMPHHFRVHLTYCSHRQAWIYTKRACFYTALDSKTDQLHFSPVGWLKMIKKDHFVKLITYYLL